ncbi:HTH domain-containing protein [Streptomyces sp. NPDC127105]|uniref:HTH domain-containing protein n=1 Tax=Streptomyces sp. NPDC127105 TaxID=3345359 RepID=UPI00365C584C
MTPASARSLRRARVAELRRAEPELSHREMAQRLGLSKDTVRRDLEAIEQGVEQTAPPVEEPGPLGAAGEDTVAQTEPQVSEGGALEDAPDGAAATDGAAQSAAPAGLPRRVAQPLAGIDLSQWPAVRRDLAVLAQTGRSAESLAHQAIVEMAHQYRQALARGELVPGQPFIVTDMVLRPLPVPAPRNT